MNNRVLSRKRMSWEEYKGKSKLIFQLYHQGKP